MDPLLATLVLILLALAGARFSFSSEQVPPGPRLLLRTGLHFLLLGFLLGPEALGLLSSDAAANLTPLLAIGLGWIGFQFGLQLESGILERFPRGYMIGAVVQGLVAFAVIYGAGFAIARALGFSGQPLHLTLLAVSAAGCISAPAGVAMVSANFRARGRVRELLFFIASVDALVGIVALELIYAGFHGSPILASAPSFAPWWFWDLASLALAVIVAVLFLWMSRYRPRREELVLFLLGTSALLAGAALQLQLSPLFVGAIAGTIVTNASRHRESVYRLMAQWEQPVYMILLMLAGAFLRFPSWWILPLALVYTGLRFVGKVLGGGAVSIAVPLPFDAPKRLGLGLVPKGGISLAMALSLTLTLRTTNPDIGGLAVIDLVFGMIVLSVVLSDALGPILTHQVLRRAGEIPLDAPGEPGARSRRA